MLAPAAGAQDLDVRSGLSGRRTVVYSDRRVIASGLIALLPDDWRDGVTRHTQPDAFAAALPGPATLAVIDTGAHEAVACTELASAAGVPRLLLLGPRDAAARAMLHAANAALLTEDLDRHTLALTINAVMRGLRVFPDGVVPLVPVHGPAGAGQPADRMHAALALVARGCRDAEIAVELNLSESAARKLVQRAVARLGARTRCQAVVRAIDCGAL